MNFQNILNAIHAEDPEVFEKISPRRHILKSFSSKVAVAALPFAIGSLFKKAYGKTTSVVSDALSVALMMEYMEDAFYKKVLEKPYIIPKENYINAIYKISTHETSHVAFLQGLITGLNVPVPPSPKFDFTAGGGNGEGPLKNFFDNFANLVGMIQAFEDMSVRVYNGQLPNLTSYPDLMKAALGIHSVEARHAARIRRIRFEMGLTEVRPWINANKSDILDVFFEGMYSKEENTTHGGVNVVNINGQNVPFRSATEAFDEPLRPNEVLKIMEKFTYQ